MRFIFLILLSSFSAFAEDQATCFAKAEKQAEKCNKKCERVGNSWDDPDPDAQLDCWEACDAKKEKAQKKCSAKGVL